MVSAPGQLPAWLMGPLRCPVTGAELRRQDGPAGDPELVSAAAEGRLAYPVRDGVPVLLAREARPVD